MSDKAKEPPKFSFGSTSGTGSGGLFGNAGNTSTSSLFGSNNAKPPSSGGLFGSAANAGQSSNLFGSAPSSTSASQPSLFGSASTGNAPTTSIFNPGGNTVGSGTAGGMFSTPNKASDAHDPKPNILGGGSSGGGSFFGQAATSVQAASSTPAPTKQFNFANASTTPAGPPPSGSSSQSLFGNQQKTQEQGTGLFGISSSTPSSSALPSNPFGSTTGNMFGSSKPSNQSTNPPASQAGAGLFGSATSKPTPTSSEGNSGSGATSLFGNLNKPQTSSAQGQGGEPKTNTLGFFKNPGGQVSASTESGQPTPKPLFGSSTNTPSSTSSSNQQGQPAAPSIFGSNVGNAAGLGGSKSLFPSSAGSQAPASSSTTPSNAPSSSPFGGFNTSKSANIPSAPADAPKSGLFSSLSTPKPANSEGAQNANTTTSAAPAPTGQTHFGGSNRAPEATSSSQPAAQATSSAPADEAAKAPNLASSTAGPRPTPQSRLKNKSMDEIITRWASDLTKYQKEFQSQALKVAEWDQMLVRNSDKIQKLYGSTLEAERATVEVERQLSAVENDQAELEYWLDHYEKQVDEMMTSQVGQGDSLSGPDQERERTYKLAEKLSDRLDEMNKDLTSMVEEINDASSHLTKTGKTDDPLSQIVRVLNGHLSQLQQIDQGTAALQAKVTAAQNASRTLSISNGGSGLGSDAVDDFYKSYMGRR